MKLHPSLADFCIERCPKCGHWAPMIMGRESTLFNGFMRIGGDDRYCMLCDTVFKEGLVEWKPQNNSEK